MVYLYFYNVIWFTYTSIRGEVLFVYEEEGIRHYSESSGK